MITYCARPSCGRMILYDTNYKPTWCSPACGIADTPQPVVIGDKTFYVVIRKDPPEGFGNAPRVAHQFQHDAAEEAIRLANKTGATFYVLKAEEIIEPTTHVSARRLS